MSGWSGHPKRNRGMWERFELFWLALEKFALFFSFVATLVILVVMMMIYSAATSVQPPKTVSPQDIDPLVDLTCQGFDKIQNTVLTTHASIDYTVPVTFNVHLDPSETQLSLVGQNKLYAGPVTIKLRDGAGNLIGESATLDLGEGNALKVGMDVTEQVVIHVPVKLDVPVQVSLSSLDLTSLIEQLKRANAAMHVEASAEPESAFETAHR